jgi:hypothetical protein
MAKNEEIDVITGDWMSEANMTLRGNDKRDKLNKKQLSSVGAAYEPYFLEELDPAIPWLAENKVKIAVNAGASDVQGLAEAVKKLIKKHGVELKVGYVDGDDVTDVVLELYQKGGAMPPSWSTGCISDVVDRREISKSTNQQEHPGLGL